ncbi:MAG: hypothetical protein P8Z35_23715, partial [Ignavibacteriaceae bacterium]
FSFGPYQASLNHVHEKYPEIKKIFHVVEGSAGPFVEYDNFNIQNYWYNPEPTIVFTNMDVFNNLIQIDSLGKVLQTEEPFCLVNFPVMPFNVNNTNRILSESQITKVDTILDEKMTPGVYILLYMLKYQGITKQD